MAFRSRIGHTPDRVPEIGQLAQLMDDLADVTIVMPSANADICARRAFSGSLPAPAGIQTEPGETNAGG